jgi:hypothetical protein
MSQIGGVRAHAAIKLSCSSCGSPSCNASRRGAEAIVSGRWAMITRVSPSVLMAVVTWRSVGDVEVRGSFVHEQQARPSVERAGQQDALLLAAGQRSAHIPVQAVVRHRHSAGFLVYAGELGAMQRPWARPPRPQWCREKCFLKVAPTAERRALAVGNMLGDAT